jgi:hypothetical protein
MRIGLAALFLLAVSAFGANQRLYMKDGNYHLVREYEVKEDRVRFYSVERRDWEEIPISLVDLDRTRGEVEEKRAALAEQTKMLQAEENAERELEAEIMKIPQNPGVYQLVNGELRVFRHAESKVKTSKGRSVLKVLSPVPMVAGKGTVELDGEKSQNIINQPRPEFYIQLSAQQRFGIIKLTPRKGVRIAQQLTFIPVTNEVVEEHEQVEIFRKQMTPDGLYKIWPVEPLPAGEYAVVEYTEGKLNVQIFDFGYKPGAPDWVRTTPLIVEK